MGLPSTGKLPDFLEERCIMVYVFATVAIVTLIGFLLATIRRGRSQAEINARLRRYCNRSLIESRIRAVCRARE
jgi:hypothetical protein